MFKPLFVALAFAAAAPSAQAWGADGHQTVGTIAAGLIKGSAAEARVANLLAGLSLAQATLWADCAKGVSPDTGYSYPNPGKYADCAPLETPTLIAEMADYVRRNDAQCRPAQGEETCHKQYHYTDVALQRSRYAQGFAGTSPHDIVGAMAAAIGVLQGQPAAPPFGIQSPREALLLLAHLMGDVHQPLHVGAVYLNAQGQRVDPDKTGFDPANFTRGGNQLIKVQAKPASPASPVGLAEPALAFRPPNLHSIWDDVPASLASRHVDATWLAAARKLPLTAGAPQGWPALWASGALEQARLAHQGLGFAAKQGSTWPVSLPADYNDRIAQIKKRQLTLAGARLAQLLKAVFPG